MSKSKGKGLQRVGDVLSVMLPTRQQQKLIDASEAIRTDPDGAELAFMARNMVLATLPHRDPGDVVAWRRVVGSRAFTIQPTIDGYTGKSSGIPFGTIPRLLLFWIVTEAVRTKKRKLILGDRLSDFMRELGLDPTHGGKRSDAYRLREQAHRLFSASVQFQIRAADGVGIGEGKVKMDIASKQQLWWSPRDPHTPALWGSWVELGADFYKEIIAAPVPLDMRALRALKRSPLALDLYALITYRSFVASRTREEQRCTWSDLHAQLGADYADLNNFRRKCVAALRKITAQMPLGLKLRRESGGFAVLPGSRPAINPR